ncbi:DEAD/DEAH box helicase family protein [Pasteurellaceae bacterium HPA106]|uniref:DEAD/DEAH box helicase family protein n=1 Tax=Spirabiliibacterium pneumoniae TaxID=221400 RepID=UPI001AAC5F3E|nr:DEAD/DEAH box helicase family protein [Spirabiliibacterium pneumoniae]MBE2895651.1 DEAD/DEAH box helicase family protein [Spirabiliibacterium pneumoniae]
MTQLFDVINAEHKAAKKYKPELLNIPDFVKKNLRYDLFDWQRQAMENFVLFDRTLAFEEFPDLKNHPTHLLFHMATGAGKTLMMAALILYYYQKGYRHFLFFVNQNNIVDKTENNFIDSHHRKYLFQPKIMDGDRVVSVNKVTAFSDNPNGIEIKFTTIQKLYNDIHIERENQTTLADLHKHKIVMLGDEAHHLNAQTKNQSQLKLDLETELKGNASRDEIERRGWEHMVLDLLLNKNGQKSQNVLLEFTATLPENDNVAQKYRDKIISTFPLKTFLQAGYTKSINLVSSQLSKKERVMHALLFAWYRHQVALKYGIANFKPVMLFRSKTIADSRADYNAFLQWCERTSAADFEFLTALLDNIKDGDNAHQQGKTRTEQALQFMKANGLDTTHLAHWVQANYQTHNVIITNSQTNKTKREQTDADTEQLLNNLEAQDNPVRAIFTVDRLTEGWDVLNLYDIVRLYEGQNSGGRTVKAGKTANATVSEKQLIGRGVRYYPFAFEDKQANKRKFDGLEHELKILEELFYYTFDEESRYITELKNELRKDGYIPENDHKVKVKFALKPELVRDDTFNNWLIWINEKIPNPNAKANNLESLQQLSPVLRVKVHSQRLQESRFTVESNNEKAQWLGAEEDCAKIVKLTDIAPHIFDKAIHIKTKDPHSLFHFNHLREKLPLKSRRELQTQLLKQWEVEFVGVDGYLTIHADDQLNACLLALDAVETHLNSVDTPFIGTTTFSAKTLSTLFGEPKVKWIDKSAVVQDANTGEWKAKVPSAVESAVQSPWYALDNFIGTTLEQDLILFLAERIGNLKDSYHVHLLRNEEVLKLHNFDDGQGFMPDFILLLNAKENVKTSAKPLHYQIFIEPKGDHLTEKDQWKADFLRAISEKYGKNHLLEKETTHYRLIGLPFFSDDEASHFSREFEAIF